MIIGVSDKNKYSDGWMNVIPEWIMEVASRKLGVSAVKDLLYCIVGHSAGEKNSFRLPEKMILKNTGMSERRLRGENGARQKLVRMGWLDYEPYKYYKINYDKMYDDYKMMLFEDE